MNDLAALGLALPAWVWTMTGWTTALLLGAALLDLATRSHVEPALRIWLYLPVFARVALGADWQSPLRSVQRTPHPLDLPADAVATGAPIWVAHAPVELSTAGLVLGACWLGGAAVLLFGTWWRARRFEHQLRMGTMAPAPLQTQVNGAVVMVHPSLGPLVFGLVDPVLVLPTSMADNPESLRTRCAIAHEQAHLDRGDLYLSTGLTFLCIALWPLMPLWLASQRVLALVEQATDRAALAAVDDDVRGYGEALLSLPHHTPTPTSGAIAMSAFHNLRGRISAITRRHTLPSALQASLVGLLALGALGSAGGPRNALAAPNAQATDGSLRVQIDHTAVLRLDDIPKAISVVRPDVANVVQMGEPKTWAVQGAGLGHTQIYVRYADQSVEIFDVDVLKRAKPAQSDGHIDLRLGNVHFLELDNTPRAVSINNPELIDIVQQGSPTRWAVESRQRGSTDLILTYADGSFEVFQVTVQ